MDSTRSSVVGYSKTRWWSKAELAIAAFENRTGLESYITELVETGICPYQTATLENLSNYGSFMLMADLNIFSRVRPLISATYIVELDSRGKCFRIVEAMPNALEVLSLEQCVPQLAVEYARSVKGMNEHEATVAVQGRRREMFEPAILFFRNLLKSDGTPRSGRNRSDVFNAYRILAECLDPLSHTTCRCTIENLQSLEVAFKWYVTPQAEECAEFRAATVSLKEEFESKGLYGSMKDEEVSEFYHRQKKCRLEFFREHKRRFPTIAKFVLKVMTMHVNSADVERAFSLYNQLSDASSTSNMKSDRIKVALMTKINGPVICV